MKWGRILINKKKNQHARMHYNIHQRKLCHLDQSKDTRSALKLDPQIRGAKL